MTLQELRQKLASGTKYDIIRAAAILRQLLLDGGRSLLHQANKEYRLPITYRVGHIGFNPNLTKEGLLFHWAQLIPDDKVYEVDETRFLAIPVLIYKSHEYTVYDVIYYTANKVGAVHIGTPKNEKEESFLSIQAGFKIPPPIQFEIDISGAAIYSISKVCLEAYRELESKINESRTASNQNI